jgi:metal-sulfur cluster biosynthetic enzyme
MEKITKEQVVEKLKTVKDPELGIDVWTLGLIYEIKIDDEAIEVLMTLTSPMCPFADELIASVEKAVNSLKAGEARVEITFEPAWEPSDELKAMMGIGS